MGVEGFAKERLRDALKVRDETAKAVAEAVGITPESLSRYVRGTSKPEPLILRAIANRLGLPEVYFLRQPVPHDGSSMFFRSLVAATKRARQGAEVRLGWLREAFDYMQQYVAFPKVSFPTFSLPDDPEAIADTTVEQIANAAREAFSVGRGPVASVVRLLEHHGGIVARVSLGSPRLDAFSQWAVPENRPFFILSSDKQAAARSRWDACHELGHMLLHRNVAPQLLNRPEVFRRAEQQAHRFAGAFLLPSDTFGRTIYVPTLSVLETQKRIWGVSMTGMLSRLLQLGLIHSEQAGRIWRSYSRQGMRLREPLDDVVAPEQPDVLRRAYEMLVKELGMTKQQLLALLPFDADELQGLLGLPLTFTKDRPPELLLHSNPRPTPESSPAPEARILPWRERGA